MNVNTFYPEEPLVRLLKDGREIKLIYGPTTEELWTIDREAFDVVVEYVEKKEEEENIVPPAGQAQSFS